MSAELQAIKELHSRVYLLYAELTDAQTIFDQALLTGLFDVGHVWLVTEQALAAPNCPTGRQISKNSDYFSVLIVPFILSFYPTLNRNTGSETVAQ
jgi:hypothetical protein